MGWVGIMWDSTGCMERMRKTSQEKTTLTIFQICFRRHQASFLYVYSSDYSCVSWIRVPPAHQELGQWHLASVAQLVLSASSCLLSLLSPDRTLAAAISYTAISVHISNTLSHIII